MKLLNKTWIRAAWLLPVIVSAMVAGSAPLRAEQSSVGLVVERRGRAFLLHEGRETPARRHSLIETGDEMITKKGASLTVQFSDGVICRIGPESRVTLGQLQKIREGKRIRLKVRSGNVAVSVEKAEQDEFEIHSPAAIASVRGTQFVVETDGKTTRVLVGEGEVQVRRTGKIGPLALARGVPVKAGHKADCGSDGIKTGILERHERKKLAIIERFKKRKERFFDRVVEQKRRDRERLDKQKSRYDP